jgi:hypothetical protein
MLFKKYFQLTINLLIISSFLYTSKVIASNSVDPTQLLLTKILAPTPILDDLEELTTTIGGRPTGSPAMSNAINWALERFYSAGIETAHIEEYSPERNWLPNIEKGEITYPSTHANILRVAAMPFAHSTPTDGLEAEVYNINSGDKAAFQVAGNKVKGRWLLVTTPLMQTLEDLFDEYNMTRPVIARAKQSGAAGVLWLSNRPGRLVYRHNLSFNGSQVPLAAAVIERDGGLQIVELLKQGKKVNVKLLLQNEIQEKPINHNVIAEIKGREIPDEIVILGAHLDSWDLGQGALDNGCNAAMVIDAARQMMQLAKEGHRPRRTLRFMLYSGEELGLYGSWFDVQNHRQELDKIKAVIIYDLGTGRTTGFSLGGRDDMATSVAKALQPLTAFGSFIQTLDASMDTDNFDYLIEGIPTLVANQDSEPYLASYHSEIDTFDKVDKQELKYNTAIASVLMWNLANTDQIAARQNRDEVIALLKSTGLDRNMKDNEIWDDFMTGRRGRMAMGADSIN